MKLSLVILVFTALLAVEVSSRPGYGRRGGWGYWRVYYRLKKFIKHSFPEKFCAFDDDEITLSKTSVAAGSESGYIDSFGAWCASTSVVMGDAITIGFDEPTVVEGILTQGATNENAFVRSFKVSYSDDLTGTFTFIQDENGNDVVFDGNVDNLSIAVVEFDEPIEAQFVKITPVGVFEDKCMRVGAFACDRYYYYNNDDGGM